MLNTWVFRLIIINIVFYIFQHLAVLNYDVMPGIPAMIYYFGLIPRLVITEGYVWQLFSYMFLHGSWFHIFFNMYALFLFGFPIEQLWGAKRFLFYYFFTGVGAGLTIFLVNLLVFGTAHIPTIGASGAVFGMLLAFGILFPKAELFVFFIPMRARTLVIIYTALTVFFLIQAGSGSGISHTGHLGGLLFGAVYFIMLKKHSIKFSSKVNLAKLKDDKSERPHRSHILSGVKDIDKLKNILKKVKSGGSQALTDDDVQYIKYMAIMQDDDGDICDEIDFDADDEHCRACETLEFCLVRELKKYI